MHTYIMTDEDYQLIYKALKLSVHLVEVKLLKTAYCPHKALDGS